MLILCNRQKERLSPGVSPLGELLVYNKRRSRIKIQALSRGGQWGFFPLSLFQGCQFKGWWWRTKKGIAERLSPEMSTKKGKSTPTSSEALLP